MGTHAERVAIKDKVSRADQDAFAPTIEGDAAIEFGRFDAEIAPVTIRARRVARPWSTPMRTRGWHCAGSRQLKLVFALPGGADRGGAMATVTAGNAPASPTAPCCH